MSAVSRRELVVGLDYEGRDTGLPVERRDATRNRLKILDAARILFEERDITSVTMEDVARAAGVGKGTLYRRFPNKGLLCQALLDEPTRRVQEEAMRLVSAPGDPLVKLGKFLALLVEFVEENLDLLYGGNEPLCGADRLARFNHPAYDWRRWTILGLLQAAERVGELESDLDLEYIAAAILAPLDVDFYYYQRRVQGIPQKRISDGLRSLAPS
ncbi:MAG: TetR/AcrR family transcriptional regulator [Rubrobacteraceae bacterium]